MDVEALVDAVAASPDGLALFCDFDGTLAPIVPDPPRARPLRGSIAALAALAERCRLVAVVSGRPVSFLSPFVPAGIRVAGLYGLEQRHDGEVRRHPEAEPWAPIVEQAAVRARAELPPAVLVEEKALSLTLHYRSDRSLAHVVEGWAVEAATETGLERRAAKMSVELHPPVAVDKGTTVAAWAEDAPLVVFAGDDAGDLPAFAALHQLRSRGARTCGIAVTSGEMPSAMLAASDLAVDGPHGLEALLRRLAGAVG